jgi:two-component system NtrC family sensor kinase
VLPDQTYPPNGNLCDSQDNLRQQIQVLKSENENLRKQFLRNERLVTVGRLTSSVVHEINNPMQAVQGALTLALEELNDHHALEAYIRLSQQESGRVVKLINLIRQIYRPQSDQPETVDFNTLLENVLTIAGDVMNQQDVSLQLSLEPALPPLVGIANQLQLAFLSLILNLSDLIGAKNGGELTIRTVATPTTLQVEFTTDAPIAMSLGPLVIQPGDRMPILEQNILIDLSTPRNIILAHGGSVEAVKQNGRSVIGVIMPLSGHTAG